MKKYKYKVGFQFFGRTGSISYTIIDRKIKNDTSLYKIAYYIFNEDISDKGVCYSIVDEDTIDWIIRKYMDYCKKQNLFQHLSDIPLCGEDGESLLNFLVEEA